MLNLYVHSYMYISYVGYAIVVKITALRDILQGEDDEREELTRNYFDGRVAQTYIVSIVYLNVSCSYRMFISYVHTICTYMSICQRVIFLNEILLPLPLPVLRPQPKPRKPLPVYKKKPQAKRVSAK